MLGKIGSSLKNSLLDISEQNKEFFNLAEDFSIKFKK